MGHTGHRFSTRWDRVAAVAVLALFIAVAWCGSAEAQGGAADSTADIREVIERLRNVIVALASAVGTLLLTIAGLRWMLAGGDPSQIDAAKRALTGAALGYGIAILATVIMAILDYVVSG